MSSIKKYIQLFISSIEKALKKLVHFLFKLLLIRFVKFILLAILCYGFEQFSHLYPSIYLSLVSVQITFEGSCLYTYFTYIGSFKLTFASVVSDVIIDPPKKMVPNLVKIDSHEFFMDRTNFNLMKFRDRAIQVPEPPCSVSLFSPYHRNVLITVYNFQKTSYLSRVNLFELVGEE